MPDYRYTALDAADRLQRGGLQAAGVDEVERRLFERGLRPIRVRPVSPIRRLTQALLPVRRRALTEFCFHLEQLLLAGLPLLEALHDVRRRRNGRLPSIVEALIEDIGTGLTFSQALGRHPLVFDPVFVGMVRAGESCGRLTETLGDLNAVLKEQDELASQTVRILLYPAFAAVVVFAVLFFLMVQVVPQLLTFVQGLNGELPVHTRLLVAVAEGVRRYGAALLTVPPGLAFAWWALRRRSGSLRYHSDRLKLRLWLIGPLMRKIALARVAACWSMMYGAGVAVLDCLSVAESVAGNEAVARALRRIRESVRDGGGIAASFEREPLFPPLMVRLLGVGETTGNIDRALHNVAYLYRRDVREDVARAHALMEPCLTLTLGLLLGWVIVSVLGPVYDLVGRMGAG